MKTAVFAGSFDPFTLGHCSVVERALPLFDRIIIAVGFNVAKKGMFSPEARVGMIKELFASNPKIEVTSYTGLTVDFCKKEKADFLLRGLRSSLDFETERDLAVNNRKLSGIETIFLPTLPEHLSISSSSVRELLSFGRDISDFIPKGLNYRKYL